MNSKASNHKGFAEGLPWNIAVISQHEHLKSVLVL